MNGQCLRHPNVKDCVGKVALQRGPIVSCFEGADQGGCVLDLALSADAVFAPRRRDDLLGGTTVLEGELIRGGERIRATAIPYPLWSNRGAGEMTVWLDAVVPADRPATATGRSGSTAQP